MFKRIKPISKASLEGIVYQIRYLTGEKNVTDEALVWHLQRILSEKGIPVDYIPSPKPWEWKKRILLLFSTITAFVWRRSVRCLRYRPFFSFWGRWNRGTAWHLFWSIISIINFLCISHIYIIKLFTCFTFRRWWCFTR